MNEIFSQISDPKLPFVLRDLSSIILPLTGTLLGLVYAGLIYWFQGALEQLKYSRTFLEDILAAHGKVLLDLLVGASMLSLFSYFDLRLLASIAFWIFAVVVALDLLRLTAERGDFATMFSRKFIPSRYGEFRAFGRKIRNAGMAYWWGAGVPFLLTIVYPIWVNSQDGFRWLLSDGALSVVLLTTTGLSLLQIRSLLLEAIDARKSIAKYLETADQERIEKLEEPETSWDEPKKKIEREIILERLKSIGLKDSIETEEWVGTTSWDSTMITTPVLMDPPIIHGDGSCQINVYVPHFGSDDETRECILTWSRKMFEAMAKSKSSVSRYRLSFFRKDDQEDSPHFAIIRATRAIILRNIDRDLSDRDFIRKMPGCYFSSGIA